ncbi:hypothetical protein RJ640_009307 [Escallonia rubra]|uniref:Uncharacterized protein n=1 Tax=Escallonia rubra TaxID=112253 RepID=A0AA88RDW1_9ASTE|nr:hypothetical protein RJ640_009307 [Escallonia rubra]
MKIRPMNMRHEVLITITITSIAEVRREQGRNPGTAHGRSLLDFKPTNKNHFVNHGLIHFGISQTMLNGLEAISKEIHVKLLEPCSRNVVYQPVIKVFSSKVRVTGSGLNFYVAFINSEKRNIKSTTAQIKDKHIPYTSSSSSAVQTISNGCSSRLIDDAYHVQTCDDTSVFCSLPLDLIQHPCRSIFENTGSPQLTWVHERKQQMNDVRIKSS